MKGHGLAQMKLLNRFDFLGQIFCPVIFSKKLVDGGLDFLDDFRPVFVGAGSYGHASVYQSLAIFINGGNVVFPRLSSGGLGRVADDLALILGHFLQLIRIRNDLEGGDDVVGFLQVFLNFLEVLGKHCHHAVVLSVYGAGFQRGEQLAERDDRRGSPKVLGDTDVNRVVGHTEFLTHKVFNARQLLV